MTFRRLLLAAVAALVCLPAVALAAPRVQQVKTATPIMHIVVIYEENHSFDNILGY